MKLLFEKIALKAFKKFDNTEVVLSHLNVFIGKNKTGKTSLLESLAWVITGQDMWGKRLNPLKLGSNLGFVEASVCCDGKSSTIKRYVEKQKKGSKTREVNDEVEIDPDKWKLLTNPRFFISLGPKESKDIICNVVDFPMSWITCKQESLDELDLKKKKTTASMLAYVNDTAKKKRKEIKEKDAFISQIEGKISMLSAMDALFCDNDVELSEEQLAVIQKIKQEENLQKETQEALQKEQKEYIKKLSSLIEDIYKEIIEVINFNLQDSKITQDNIFYKEKSINNCSNSEQLFCGLDIINAISKITQNNFPCLVDNAEAAHGIDVEKYPEISQMIFSIVSSEQEQISIWEKGVVNPIEDKTVLPRAAQIETLYPKIETIVVGW